MQPNEGVGTAVTGTNAISFIKQKNGIGSMRTSKTLAAKRVLLFCLNLVIVASI